MEFFVKFLDKFELFIKRAMIPSIVGITFMSLILSIGIVSLLMCKWYIFIVAFIVMKLIHRIGLEHLKTKFRSRAIRMYINFLIGENKKCNFLKIEPNKV